MTSLYALEFDITVIADDCSNGEIFTDILVYAGEAIPFYPYGYQLFELYLYRTNNGVRDFYIWDYDGNEYYTTYSLSTTYTVKFQFQADGTDLSLRAWVEGVLQLDNVVPYGLDFDPSKIKIILFSAAYINAAVTWNSEVSLDNFTYWMDGTVEVTDDFEDEDLTLWPLSDWPSDLNNMANSETGGVYLVDDGGATPVTKEINRYRNLPEVLSEIDYHTWVGEEFGYAF